MSRGEGIALSCPCKMLLSGMIWLMVERGLGLDFLVVSFGIQWRIWYIAEIEAGRHIFGSCELCWCEVDFDTLLVTEVRCN